MVGRGWTGPFDERKTELEKPKTYEARSSVTWDGEEPLNVLLIVVRIPVRKLQSSLDGDNNRFLLSYSEKGRRQ